MTERNDSGPGFPRAGVTLGKISLVRMRRRYLEAVHVDESAQLSDPFASSNSTNRPVDAAVRGEPDSS